METRLSGSLTTRQQDLLARLAEAQLAVSVGGHTDFLTATDNEGSELILPDGRTTIPVDLGDLDELAAQGLIRLELQGRHGDKSGRVTNRGLERAKVAEAPDADGERQRLNLQRFDVGDLIDMGLHGKVYQGRDPVLTRDVALKFLNPSAELSLGLLAQAKAQAQLSHPHVLAIFALGEARDPELAAYRPCIVLELVKNATTLEDLLGMGLRDEREALRLGDQLLQGLGAIHSSGLVHGDLHAGNILVDEDGSRLRIIDIHYLESLAGR